MKNELCVSAGIDYTSVYRQRVSYEFTEAYLSQLNVIVWPEEQ